MLFSSCASLWPWGNVNLHLSSCIICCKSLKVRYYEKVITKDHKSAIAFNKKILTWGRGDGDRVVSEVEDKVILPLSILLFYLMNQEMNHTNDTY